MTPRVGRRRLRHQKLISLTRVDEGIGVCRRDFPTLDLTLEVSFDIFLYSLKINVVSPL